MSIQENKSKYDEEVKTNWLLIISRYLVFWPYFLISVIVFVSATFIFLRYAEYTFLATSRIEIIDKAQDSEMSLPTSMTIFNRSMINLENEIGVLKSYSLHEKTVKHLKSNVRYFTTGNIKTSENYIYNWFDEFTIDFKIDTDTIVKSQHYILENNNGILKISKYKDDDLVKSYQFENLSTNNKNHDLPFEITINKSSPKFNKTIVFDPLKKTIYEVLKNFDVSVSGTDSDQLNLNYFKNDKDIAITYLDRLIYEFDQDGIEDRRLEYKRTIEFVDSRAEFLSLELEKIENRKRDFKKSNKLTDIKSDASINIDQQSLYNADLFKSKSQKDLVEILKNSIATSKFEYLPVNIGITENRINELIVEYNDLLKKRNRFLLTAGPSNKFLINIENQLSNFLEIIKKSVDNYIISLDKNIKNIREKENEFLNVYTSIPEKEKILRSIERELEVKESLFLLLIQKREEAAINFAVVKPSIKIIDNASVSELPISPNKYIFIISSILIGLFIPFIILYILFYTDNKIHIKSHLEERLENIPVIAEIPYINDKNTLNTIAHKLTTRSPLLESVRMLLANLNFTFSLSEKSNSSAKIILVTSSVKGEGKTLVSTNFSSVLSNNNRVILIGADLRNPQIHKIINKDKNKFKGVSNIIYENNMGNYAKYVLKEGNLDILLSGDIPPNPSEILSSERFKKLIDIVSKDYDYVIIDSAPCLMVSDTFEISKYIDCTLYIARANFTEIKLCEFINECSSQNKLKNVNVVLNSVGKSGSYGYKYGYQYGYKYGYKYSYNYGYGYGYGQEQ